MKSALLVLTAAMFAAAPLPSLAGGTIEGAYEVIANAYGFGVDIPSCPEASKNIRQIHIDDLHLDCRETTSGLDVEYRLYGPGQAHWGSARFTSACTLGGSKELQAWFMEVVSGKNIRKNITVTLFKSDKTAGRSYTLLDCFPTQFRSNPIEGSPKTPTMMLEVEFSSVELASGPRPRLDEKLALLATTNDLATELGAATDEGHRHDPDTLDQGGQALETTEKGIESPGGARPRRFDVAIEGPNGVEHDTAWEVVSLPEAFGAGDKFRTNSPGHKTVGELTLRGAMTDARQALCTWVNDSGKGRTGKRMTITVTEITRDGSPGRSFVCYDCCLVAYHFPRMSVTNTTGNVMEEVSIKPIRVELK